MQAISIAERPPAASRALSVTKTFVSVIIPVYNNAEGLRACLAALEAQTYPADSFEVVVADNGSKTEEDPAAVVAKFERARLVRETKVGSYAARNAAAAVALGDVFAFTDSDCLPDPSWLERGVSRLRAEPGVGLVAGGIEVFAHDRAHPTVAETIDLHEGFPQEKFVRDYHFGATANMFTTRAVWEKNGPFDSSLKSGGDLNWGNRVYSNLNLALAFEPGCVVRHPARRTFAELKAKTARVVGGGTTLQMRAGSTLHHFARLMKPPIGRSLRIVRNADVEARVKLGCVAMFFLLKGVEIGVAFRVALGAETARS